MPGDALTWLTYAGLGVIVGFFSGLLGIGGGSMIVPTSGSCSSPSASRPTR